MADIGWVDPDADLDEWADAPVDSDTLARYLGAAYGMCLAFMGRLAGDETPALPTTTPEVLVLAQIMQARALYRSMLAGSGDAIGADGLSVTVFPMDWTVKLMLRPYMVPRMG